MEAEMEPVLYPCPSQGPLLGLRPCQLGEEIGLATGGRVGEGLQFQAAEREGAQCRQAPCWPRTGPQVFLGRAMVWRQGPG